MSEPGETVDLLAIAAHPDDVELGCGGTLLALAARGRSFGICDLTRGEMGTRGTPAMRAEEAERAAAILGARFRETLDLGDGGLRTDRAAELAVVEVIRRHRPRLVITSWERDRHPDHVRASRLVTEAAWYAGLRQLQTGLPAHRPQQVIYFPATFFAEPTFLVDVSAVFEKKLEAIRAFGSQFHDPSASGPETFISRKGFLEGLTSRARSFGRLAGVAYAEGFVSSVPPLLLDAVAAFEGYEPGFPR